MLGRIAVHLDLDKACRRRVRAAALLAAAHDATLVGIHASFRRPPPYVYKGFFVSDDVNDLLRQKQREDLVASEAMLREVAGETGVAVQWRSGEGLPEEILCEQVRYCDVLVTSQPNGDEPGPTQMPSLLASVMLGAGRPMLMLPSVGELVTIGRRALVCWDGQRESARALADAAPLLQEATDMVALRIDPPNEPEAIAQTRRADFLAYCASKRYPIPQEITRDSSGIGIGNCILNAAADHDCDLIVMGAYGHSRLQQAMLGGTTRTIMESMTVPVLFAH
ncbi:Universal stress protein family protein [Pigmentiphaga humi]|uniref:Universal stress protein family protein n=1 Tax=Pigmentiphaga humi TaxID=2478468 RepID=A0A3P4B0Y1_9BURK|nr:universal stress protein [Pigmentiphaga humi]VCU69702.1 Universal stress protein family protein [Pigmentiphaga humi]